jgi:hypothetical protein
MAITSVQVSPLHAELLTRLKSQLNPVGIDVVDGYIGQGEDIGRQADKVTFKPTVVLLMGDLGRMTRSEGIAQPSLDLKSFSLSVMAVCASNYQVTQALDVVVRALEDYQPTTQNCSMLTVVGSGYPRTPVSTFLNPLRFAKAIGFTLAIGPTVVP